MKSRNLLAIFIALFLIVVLIIVGIVIFLPSSNDVKDNIFECTTFDEFEQYATDNNIAHEKHDNTLHLFNVETLNYTGYCIAEFTTDTEEIQRIDFYMTFENDGELSQNIANVKTAFLDSFGFEGEYEYFPLDGSSDNVGEQEFLAQKASKELFVYEENTTWNVSWYITDDGVSAKISKSVSH